MGSDFGPSGAERSATARALRSRLQPIRSIVDRGGSQAQDGIAACASGLPLAAGLLKQRRVAPRASSSQMTESDILAKEGSQH
jgi:hypothetical protein